MSTPSPEPASSNPFEKLYYLMEEYFNLAEVRQLCFLLSVDYDNLEGGVKSDKIRELILQMRRENKLPELLDKLREQRPDIIWPQYEELNSAVHELSYDTQEPKPSADIDPSSDEDKRGCNITVTAAVVISLLFALGSFWAFDTFVLRIGETRSAINSTPTVAVLTPVPSSTPTPTQTPDPRATISSLMAQEAEAVLNDDLTRIGKIFLSEATVRDAQSGQSWSVEQRYRELFANQQHLDINHVNPVITINGDGATAVNDSCGVYIDAQGQRQRYGYPRGDRWAFRQDGAGRWWISSLSFNNPSPLSEHRYSFEKGDHGCWQVRYDAGEAQGADPFWTNELSYEGNGALQFPFDLGQTARKRAQVIQYNMPFAGNFEAYVYAPSDAPEDLVASFFAMEFDHDPWNYHGIDTGEEQIIPLSSGRWTQVAWQGDVSNWQPVVHLLGIEIRRESGGGYKGHVLIDNVSIQSQ